MAARFWVGGTGTWDAADTTYWSASTGGAGGASVPGSSDAVTLDAASGGGTVTVNTTVTVQSITCGAFTGTLDFSANNNNVNLSAAGGFNASGAGTRTINLGNGTWTLTNSGAAWNFGTTTGLTFSANSSTIVANITATIGINFTGGGLTYNNLTINGNTSFGINGILGANTFANLSIAGPNAATFQNAVTQTITALTLSGSSTAQLYLFSLSSTALATISVAAGEPTMTWAGLRLLACTGGATFAATNSFDLGRNTGVTITVPGGALLRHAGMNGGLSG